MKEHVNRDNLCMEFCSKAQTIYNHLTDVESQFIFTQRLLYSTTQNPEYIHNVIETTPEGKIFSKLMAENDDFYLWGAGNWGREIIQAWRKNWKGVIDNNEKLWGQNFYDVPVYSPNVLKENSENVKVLVTTRLYYKEIKKQLLNMGIVERNIINVGEMLDEMAERQYFSLEELPHCSQESFVDAGSLDAMSAIRFIKWSGDFSKVFCFEPDSENIKKCKNTLSGYILEGNAKIIPFAAWSKKEALNFSEKGNGISCIDDNGEKSIMADTIDNLLQNERVTFIKMDIEGAELHALYGCSNIIKTQKPKLAICIYHKPQDLISLADIILSLNPDYKLYLRHYSLAQAETVLYAIP